MPNQIATVQAVTGVVKAVSIAKGERILQVGDVIYADDILSTSNLLGSTVSTTDGLTISLSFSKNWQFSQGNFFETVVISSDESAQLSNSIDRFLNVDRFESTEIEIEPIEDEGFNNAYRVGDQSRNGRVVRLDQVRALEQANDKGLLSSPDGFVSVRQPLDVLANNDRFTIDRHVNPPIIEIPSLFNDIKPDKISLQLNTDDGLYTTDNITSDTQINLVGLEATSIWEYSLDSGVSWLSGIGSFFNLVTATAYSAQQIQVKTFDLAGNIHIEKMAAVTINGLVSEVTDADSTANVVSEHIAIGTAVGITAAAIDIDSITYSLTINPDSLFTINSTTGVVTLAANLDFETATHHDIEVTATSDDGSSQKESFRVYVENADDITEITLLDVDNDFAVITVPHEIAHIVANVADDEGIAYPSSTVSALHGAVVLDNVTGNIIYTSNNDNLTDTITITAVDNTGEITIRTIPINVNLAPALLMVKGISDTSVSATLTPNIVGETAEVDLSIAGTILQTGPANWGTTITTANSVLASKGVLVEFQSQGSGNAGMWGLNISGQAATARSYEVIDYAIYLLNGAIYIYENGSGLSTSETYIPSDVLSIEINKESGAVTYLKNGAVFYTSSHTADLDGTYNFTGAPLTTGIGISSLQFGSTDALAIFENAGTNKTIATLSADDTDSQSWTYTLVSGDGDNDNAAVTIGGINNNEIILIANPVIAAQDNYSVRIKVTDEYGNTHEEIATFKVITNQAPIDLLINDSSGILVSPVITPEIIGETSEVNISVPGTILQTGSANWGTTITTANSVLASKGVVVEFQAQGSGNAGMWGLNIAGQATTARSYEVIDYAIYLLNGAIYIYENGLGMGTSETYVFSDLLSIDINKESGAVTYLKNGVVFYTSTHTADLQGAYNFTGAPLTAGIGISNLQFGNKDTLAINENAGANQTVAILKVDDADSASWTYTLVGGDGDNDNLAVTIGGANNNEIILTANPVIATQESYSIRIKVTDEYGNTYEEVVVFKVEINAAPIDLIVHDNAGILVSPIVTPEIIGEISEVNTSIPGTILQTGPANWGTTVTSANSVLASKGVLVEFQAQGAGNAGMWGLNISGEVATARSYEVIDYAIYLLNGSIYIYENGLGIGTSEAYVFSDVLSIDINKESGTVTYLKNGAVFYTSSHIADLQGAYNFTGAPLTTGIGISNLQFGNTDTLTIYENAGANQTIAILAVDDTDSTSWTYTLVSGDGDNDNAAVIIGGANRNEVILLADPSIAVKENYSVRVRVTNNYQESYDEVIEFTVIENAAPIDIGVKNPLGESFVGLEIPTISGETDEVDLTTPGSIIKTGPNNAWTTTITSQSAVLASEGINVEFQAEGAGNAGMWGINIVGQATTNTSYVVIDYAIYLSGSAVSVYENGISKGSHASYTSADIFSIEMDKNTGKVTYLKNDVVFYISTITADLTAEYNFTGAPYSSGIGISNLKFTDLDSVTVYQNEGANKTIAILNVDDPDSSSWSYALVSGDGDSDNAAVTIGGINNNEIILAANPNIANQENYTIRVKVTDNHNKSYQEIIEFTVTENAAPTDILVSTWLFIPTIVGETSEVDITTPGTIIKAAATGWATTISSEDSVLGSKGVQITFTAQGTGNAGMWGLNISGQAATVRSYDVIDYAIYLLNGTTYIFENSLNMGAFSTYSTTDTFSVNINKDSGEVTYLQNDTIFYTSSNLADLTKEYLFTGAPYASGIGISHVKFGSLESIIYEDEGTSKTAVFLGVEDEDSSSWVYSLISGTGDSDNDAVTIGGVNNNEIILTANPNIANKESYSVRVRVTDSYNNSYEEIVTFKVIENAAPIDIIVSTLDAGNQNSLVIPIIAGETSEVDLVTPDTIIKTSSSGWTTTIYSDNSVLASKGVQVAFSAQGAGNAGMWGLNISGQAITSRSYDVIDYAIYLLNGSIFIFENSANMGKFNTYSTTDTFAVNIDKDTGVVTYLQNGSVFYTSVNHADLSGEYLFTGTPYSPGIGISHLKFGSLEPTIYENEGADKTVVILEVKDEDSSSWTYTLVPGEGDGDNGAVTIGGINNNEIILRVNPNIAEQASYTVRVRVTDNHNKSYEEIIGFNVIKNTAPTDFKVKDVFIGELSEVDLSIAGSLLSVGGIGWDTLVNSKEKVLASDGVTISFKAATDSLTVTNGMFGLNASHLTTDAAEVNHSYEVIDYALSLTQGDVHVYENGVLSASHGTFTINDVFTINIEETSGVVTYLKNDEVFYTSLNNATLTDEFWFAAAPYADGAGITDLALSFSHFTVYEYFGANQSIATLIATDEDSSAWLYSLVSGIGDQDNSAVEIGGSNNDELIFIGSPSVALQEQYSVRVQVMDNQGNTLEKVMTFTIQPDPYLVDLLLKNAAGDSLEETFAAPAFKGEVGEVDLSTAGIVTKTAATAWSTLIETEQTAIGNSGPNVEFKASGAGNAGMWGLSLPGESDVTSYTVIDYAIYLSAGSATVYENGSPTNSLGAYTTSDTFAINVNKDSGQVTYLKNGAVVYSSLTNADLSAEYTFVGAPYGTGEGVTDIKFKQLNDVTIYENIGENSTVAFLETDEGSTSWTYSIVAGIGDDDNALMRIGGVNNDELILVANPNVPTQDSYSVRVRLTNTDSTYYEEIVEFNVVERNLSTPLILDLDGDGVETLAQANGVMFDIDADGILDQTGWATGDDGFLVRDVNQDGLINNASELFGEHTIKQNSEKAKDGFAALSDLDSNLDGVIDENDTAYKDLQIWQDSNQDGLSQAHELYSLVDRGISSIDLNAFEVAENNQGNFTGLRSLWTDTQGDSHSIDDVWLSYQAGKVEILDLSDLIHQDDENEDILDRYLDLQQVASDLQAYVDEVETLTEEAFNGVHVTTETALYDAYFTAPVYENLIDNQQISADI